MPTKKNFFLPLISHPNVLRMLALSGGFDLETSCKKLTSNVCMVACWNRAFIQSLTATQTPEEFSHTIYKACKTIASAGVSPDAKALQLIMLKEKKGFFNALDQHSADSNKALLEPYGIPPDDYKSNSDLLKKAHELRTRIITNKAYHGGRIIATIIPKATMDRKIKGLPSAKYLWNVKHIVVFLRLGVGLQDEKNGCQLAENIPNFDKLLSKARENGISGVKIHSCINDANEEGIQSIVNQQFAVADRVMRYGMVPLLEPEVNQRAKRKELCEELLLKCITQVINDLTPDQKVIFRFTIPTQAKLYRPLCNHPNTLRVIARSDGCSRAVASRKLSENPGMCAGFGRSFVEGLKVSDNHEQFTKTLESSCDTIYKAIRW
jgi:fructose-bisphosphate aldolase class I